MRNFQSHYSSSQFLAGKVASLILIFALFYPFLIIAPILIVIFYTKNRINKKRLLIFVICAVILLLSVLKDFYLNASIDYSILISSFPIAVLAIIILKKINSEFMSGIKIGVNLIFALDFAFNIWSMIFGIDFFGRPVVIRDDGNRSGGLLSHSFYSVSISMVYIIANVYEKKNFLHILAGLINIYFAGTFRGFIHIGFLFIFALFLYKLSWVKQFIIVLFCTVSIFLATLFSVQSGYLSESSGNAYRLFAWSNAVNLVVESPFLGVAHKFESWRYGTVVSEDSIVETGTAESMFLGDAIRYGLIFVSIKIILILYFAKIFERIKNFRILNKNLFIIQYIPMFLLIDYFLLSLWGSVYFSFYIAIFCAHGVTLVEKSD
jgi:hypothetical protein